MAKLEESEIFFIFIAGSAGMILLVAAMALFIATYQKKLLREHKRHTQLEQEHSQKMINAQLESQEKERVRIAADLHDSVGSLLFGAKLNISFIQRTSQPDNNVKSIYDEIIFILDQSIESIRRISWELTPQAFQEAGLSQSVQQLCSRINGKGRTIEYKSNGSIVWNDEDALQVYRIIQELINNAIKHSGAQLITVNLKWTLDSLQIVIEDNGIGLLLTNVRQGVGWWNVQQRANQLQARIHIGKPPIHTGTIITVIVPLKNGNTENQSLHRG